MSSSDLVSVAILSPHCRPRTHTIDTITIHHAATVGVSARQIGEVFRGSRVASSNYGIGINGEIGLYVPEDKRAITSSNSANDDRAVTIEVANSAGDPDWPVSSASYSSLILLVTDICRRNGIRQLLWRNSPDFIGRVEWQNMTVHRWFAATACPGDYLMSKMKNIAESVNARLGTAEVEGVKRYDSIAAMPEWAKITVKKLCRIGILEGKTNEKDVAGYPISLDLSQDMLRLLVINDRAGVYDNVNAGGVTT